MEKGDNELLRGEYSDSKIDDFPRMPELVRMIKLLDKFPTIKRTPNAKT